MKFSIRDLQLVTVIAAVCVAWWLDHRRQAAKIDRFKTVPIVPKFSVYSGYGGLPNSSAPAPSPPKP